MTSESSLVKKLAAVMEAVKRIPKRGRNLHFGYDFATEADIVEAIRHELATRDVMLIPSVEGYDFRELAPNKKGEPREPLTILRMSFTFMDGESHETIVKPWLGVGQDGGDKGVYKGMTGGEKYFLLKTFLIPTGDDPERHEERDQQRERATAKPDAAAKKARPPLPDGFVYLDKVVPRSKGNREWAEVIASNGEEHIASAPALISLATTIVQENVAVRLATHQNTKGRSQLDAIERWQSAVLSDALDIAKPNGTGATVPPLKASEVAF